MCRISRTQHFAFRNATNITVGGDNVIPQKIQNGIEEDLWEDHHITCKENEEIRVLLRAKQLMQAK